MSYYTRPGLDWYRGQNRYYNYPTRTKQAAQAPMDPAMMGGAPPMDPAMMGAPPMDPAMMGMPPGGAPPMDPAMMGGAPPMDPAMMGMPPGGAPPMDPAMMGMPPVAPPPGGAAPPPADPAAAGDPAAAEGKKSKKQQSDEIMQKLLTSMYNLQVQMAAIMKKINVEIPAEALIMPPDAEMDIANPVPKMIDLGSAPADGAPPSPEMTAAEPPISGEMPKTGSLRALLQPPMSLIDLLSR